MKDDNRRKALKALAIGAPAVWAKPVVDSVMLPAHASTSGCDCFPFDGDLGPYTSLAPNPTPCSPVPEGLSQLVVYSHQSPDCSDTGTPFIDVWGPINGDPLAMDAQRIDRRASRGVPNPPYLLHELL